LQKCSVEVLLFDSSWSGVGRGEVKGRLFLLLRPLYRIVRLHLPGHLVEGAMLKDTTEETQ
jgi:hypothetical protein